MNRIGVFICHCGLNIAGTVDVKKVAKLVSDYSEVVYATDYMYMCSDPGQDMIKEMVKEKKLDGVVVAACSPTMHETTFRNTIASVGLNPYRGEIANIREQCSWVHQNTKEIATEKAVKIIEAIIEKLKLDKPLVPLSVPVTKRALVIGGGIAGIQASLDIADSGYEVILVEKNQSIGGHMLQLSETFPTLDCPQCIATPKMVQVGQHPKIKLLAFSEVEEVSGYVGNFKVKIRRKASFVDWDKCTGCGFCMEKCPAKVPSEFNEFLSKRKAIYTLFPQAVPNKPVIDSNNCLYFTKGKCRVCEKNCSLKAINFEQKDSFVEENVGAIIVATGYDLMNKAEVGEYGYGKYKDVIDGLQLERLLAPAGPTEGIPYRPSDGKIPKEVVFIQCVGSRDPEHYYPYCSKICCMYTVKQAMIYKHAVPDGQAYVFYMDIRCNGKGYEEFLQRGIEEDRILYLRGRVSKIFKDGDKIRVWGADTLTGRKIEISADLVVLAMAMVPSKGAKKLAEKLRLTTDDYGFLTEAHPKLRPVESLTAGYFLAGAAQAPKDIPETVAQASGAASKVDSLFSKDELYHEPIIANVDEEVCVGCGICEVLCPYEAIEIDEQDKVAKINPALCEGCGTCCAACPSGALELEGFRRKQILSMIKVFAEV
ncbi:MAG: CoB--CoM heterodisulfide reductase iron-sulfur subunit A family protein [bacterium]|nr:CoB--CoM heterodisulfide reductase iron-sulfur subunit A family protein [bacterium]MBU1427948.1 CoB--CoM heterodisulfide reductase iron-sulfur subunit A family protein [bacterium]MBU2439855.1 CoB--CoM heterodisulfide reductase iron-sulfur subunit A family protein [bacterium]